MAQLFSRPATTIFRVVLTLTPLAAAAGGGLTYAWLRSDAAWGVGKPAPQPIPFRHDLHAGVLKIDCRYCHTGAERAADAGMPSAQTCMTCHSQIWAGASVLEPLRTALALDTPLRWRSVSRLPDFAYFHHGAHVSKGVTCATCHGRVEEMPKTVKARTLSMGWCLECHRDPGSRLPLHTAVLATAEKKQPSGQAPRAHDTSLLMSCSTCHR